VTQNTKHLASGFLNQRCCCQQFKAFGRGIWPWMGDAAYNSSG